MAKSQRQDHDGYRGPSAAPIGAPVWKHRHYIDRPAALRELAAKLARAQVLAIDAEFVQSRGPRRPTDNSHRLALLQFAHDDGNSDSYVVDALRLPDLSPLQEVLDDPHILKLFHGISADARMLATRGLIAHQTLDLEAVSRSIFGQRESGLQSMLARACNIRLDKSLQRADWARRPLTPAMVAYAARDAEMTLVLHGWLAVNYPWAIGLHLLPADESQPAIAPWLLPYLEGPRARPIELALLDAGLDGNMAGQEAALRTALAAVQHPSQRARLMRVISDLGLFRLGPDLRPFLASPASEERAGAVRAIGRMRLPEASELVRPLLDDAVQEVRQAAQLALEQQHLSTRVLAEPRPTRQANGVWTIGEASAGDDGISDDPNDWRSALRARFGISAGAAEDSSGGA